MIPIRPSNFDRTTSSACIEQRCRFVNEKVVYTSMVQGTKPVDLYIYVTQIHKLMLVVSCFFIPFYELNVAIYRGLLPQPHIFMFTVWPVICLCLAQQSHTHNLINGHIVECKALNCDFSYDALFGMSA